MGELGSQGFVPIPFAGNGLERVDVSGDLPFIVIFLNAAP
jgi:hypothetical protein